MKTEREHLNGLSTAHNPLPPFVCWMGFSAILLSHLLPTDMRSQTLMVRVLLHHVQAGTTSLLQARVRGRLELLPHGTCLGCKT